MAITTVKKAASKAASKSPNLNLPKARSEPRTPERPKYSTRKDSTNKHNGTIDKENRESKQPDPSSNIPAATSSHRARQPIQDTTEQTEAKIPPKPNTSRTGNVQIYDADDDDEEGPSKSKERDKDSNERTNNSKERDNDSDREYSEDDDDNSDVQLSDSDDENDEGASCQAKDSKPNKTEEICVICMETVKNPRTLLCGHVFCEDCIEQQFTYKEACPTCGRVVGTIEGDQPDGKMTITIDDLTHCAGFEHVGQIIITYSFENGKQGPSHPNPGAIYKGITRKAFLPKNEHGKRICKMLWVAFERRLVFTVGSSRTTGKEGVITWNDIHHKTDPKPNSQFGYPDDSYLDRVTDELKAKGVTEDDIVDTSFELLLRRGWRPRR
ncbi:DTX3L-like protein [Mya arenaria]|uniref:E3 ubiquitin-protein ligase n=2 Tax=Mya arenaria TaxID=6604 RepID=A0ABY7FIC4_MYAAR|nr:DTX3L-like protein [Mya arenaria]